MYYGRKKGIIISIIVIVLIIALAIGGMLVYLTTDLFKSNQTLFFKYIGQALEDIKYLENTQLSDIEKLKEQMPYEMEGNLTFNMNGEENALSQMNLAIDSKVNKTEEKSYSKIDLYNGNQELFTLEYANSNNIYALKSDEIVTAFLGVENENLKVLAQKLGIYDTSAIPDSIEKINVNQIFELTDEEKTHITETYLSVIIQNINKENFTKEKDITVSKEGITYNTTGYRLNLNAEELKQIEIALLETLKQDSITLNIIATKAKLLGLDENYTQINSLTNEIQTIINEINNINDIANEGISIIVHVDNGKVVTTEIIYRNEIKYTIYGETEENQTKRYLLTENLSTTSEYSKIEVQQIETRDNTETTNNILINIDDNVGIDMYLNNTGAASENNLKSTYEININQEDQTLTLNYEQEINFKEEINDIIELSRENCAVLNDYTTEQLQVLMQSIIERITTVITQKIQTIGLQMNQQSNEVQVDDNEDNRLIMY